MIGRPNSPTLIDVMVEDFGLATPPLLRLAMMVRGTDTARLDLCPEAPGLLAASLGLSRMYDDELGSLRLAWRFTMLSLEEVLLSPAR